MKQAYERAKYIIRLDDACPTMHRAQWQRIEDLLNSYNIKPIVAIVPENKDPDLELTQADPQFWEKALDWQQNGWTIALHGYQHLYNAKGKSLVPTNSQSEFTGLPLAEQQQKIRLGYEILIQKSLAPTVWVAPSHNFDEQTIEALRSETPIRTISDGIAFHAFSRFGFNWIPQQLWSYKPMWRGLYTICLHPNTIPDAEFDQLSRDLAAHSDQFISAHDVADTTRPRSALDRLAEVLFFSRLWIKRKFQ